mgnify:FL=1
MKSRLPHSFIAGSGYYKTIYKGHYALVCKDMSLWIVFSNKDDAMTYLTECPPSMAGDPMRLFKASILLDKEIKLKA